MQERRDSFYRGGHELPIAPEPPTEELMRIARIIPQSVRLGTSSWASPEWKGIVWSRFSSTRNLALEGLRAYSSHPLFSMAGVDRAYYRPLSMLQYAGFAEQVPSSFRFLVKAPSEIVDPVRRGMNGKPLGLNPGFLDSAMADRVFIQPVLEGLGPKAGPIVFEFPALPREWVRTREDCVQQIARLEKFLDALPPVPEEAPNAFYAVEIRTPAMYTPRFASMLSCRGVRLVVGVHPAMPSIVRQMNAVFSMDGSSEVGPSALLRGPLVIRWSLAVGNRFDDEVRQYGQFSRIQRPDPVTREGIVNLILAAVKSNQRAFVVASNRAEGCAPLTMMSIAKRLAEKISLARDEAAAKILRPVTRRGF